MKVPEAKTTIRLVLFLARAGLCSRREAGDAVKAGRVKVNGTLVTAPGTPVDPVKDYVRFDGKVVRRWPASVYILFHKPRNVLTARDDPGGRPTVFDYLEGIRTRVEPVGRLDWDTSGLLLLTNDGDLAQKLMRPASKVEKLYQVVVRGRPGDRALTRLERGVVIDGRRTLPARVRMMGARGKNGEHSEILLAIVEGRHHQVKKMCVAVGHPVRKLRRIAFGPLTLTDLPSGKFRSLTDEEIDMLRRGNLRCAEL